MSDNIFSAASGITIINERPNIIITYPDGADSSAAEKISGLLKREEINVYTEPRAWEALTGPCINGAWHMVIITGTSILRSGFDIIEKIRSFSDIPVMTVSENPDEIYKIMALSKGADICMDMTGGSGEFELKARIVTMLRRELYSPVSVPCSYASECVDILVNGDICIDRKRREFFSNGRKVRLTAIEYGIVEYLMENCGDVCTVDDIYRSVWNENPYSVRKTVVEHIRRIRSKIEPDPKNPSYIKVVFGVGYKMERVAG